MATVLRFLQHGSLFFAAKSTVLFAPILAASILTNTEYGQLEWWLALSMSLGPVLAMGAPRIVAYGTVGERFKRHVTTAIIFILLVGTFLIASAFIIRSVKTDWKQAWLGIVLLQTVLICFQTTLAARLKGLGKGAWASLSESILYASLLLALILSSLGLDFHAIYGALLVCSSALATIGIFLFSPSLKSDKFCRKNYASFFRLGIPFMISGSLMAGFMASPRVLLGVNGSPESVGEFALAFRWLSIAIAAHQFIHTLFFPKIFGDVNSLQREKLLLMSVAIVGLAVISEIVFLHLAPLLNYGLPLPTDFGLLLPIAVAMVLWATTASLEGALFRLGAAGKQTLSVFSGLVVMSAISGSFVYSGAHSAKIIGYAWVAGLVVIITSQYLSLRALGECAFRLTVTSCGICVLVSAIFFMLDTRFAI